MYPTWSCTEIWRIQNLSVRGDFSPRSDRRSWTTASPRSVREAPGLPGSTGSIVSYVLVE